MIRKDTRQGLQVCQITEKSEYHWATMIMHSACSPREKDSTKLLVASDFDTHCHISAEILNPILEQRKLASVLSLNHKTISKQDAKINDPDRNHIAKYESLSVKR